VPSCDILTCIKSLQDGRPIYIERLGNIDVKALYAVTTQERLLKQLVSEYERCAFERFPACSLVKGELVETSCTILDLQGVGLGQFYKVRDYVSKASTIGQDRYPETMGKFYIINAPWGFATIWNLIKGWLDEVTVAKIHIHGSDYKQHLLAQIPAENLPGEYGGTCRCVGGCSLADQGPWQDPNIMQQVRAMNEAKRVAATNANEKPEAVESNPTPTAPESSSSQTDTAPTS
jgi:hypothetical protein